MQCGWLFHPQIQSGRRKSKDTKILLRVSDLHKQLIIPRFVDDVQLWATLVDPGDQLLFKEISSHLWGQSSISIDRVIGGNFEETRHEALRKLKELVDDLVWMTGISDHCSANMSGSYRLKSLRQRHFSSMDDDHSFVERRSLAEWDPWPPEVRSGLHSDALKPPDPGEKDEHFSILKRITTLMAGAIFGVMLLFLCCKVAGPPFTSTLTS